MSYLEAKQCQAVLDRLSYGLYVVSSCREGRLNGQISDALMQVTAVNPQVAVSIHKDELTHEFISAGGVFGASILTRQATMELISLFGFRSGREIDKFSKVAHRLGKTGCPIVLEGTAGAFEARVVDRVDLGTHTLFIGALEGGELLSSDPVLTYRHYTHAMRGRVGIHSPSYHEAKAVYGEGAYLCATCGWIYDPAVGLPRDGIPAGTPFAELPDDWLCPICWMGKEVFTPLG